MARVPLPDYMSKRTALPAYMQPTTGAVEKPLSTGQEDQFRQYKTRQETLEQEARRQTDFPGQAFLVKTGQGLYNIANALGLAADMEPEEKQALKALESVKPYQSMAGEAVGESAPFAPLSSVIPAAGLSKYVASGLLGAAEGGTVARAHEGDTTTGAGIGGGMAVLSELVMPRLFSLANKVFRRITGKPPNGALLTSTGVPTPEFKSALDSAGVDFDKFTDESIDYLKKQGTADLGEMQRLARFQEQGIPYTRGDITQELPQQGMEARLFESSTDPMATPLRNRRLEQSNAIRNNLENMVERTGVPEGFGEKLKNALASRQSIQKADKTRLYKQAGQYAKEAGGIPILTDAIEASMPDERTLRRIRGLEGDGPVNSFMELMAEFGIDKSDAAQELLQRKGIKPTILDLETFEILRQDLNQLMQVAPGQPNRMAVLAGPVKEALDKELDTIGRSFEQLSPVFKKNQQVLDTIKAARQAHQQLIKDFSPDTITGKLIAKKRDGYSHVIEASKVYKEIIGPSKPPEYVDKVVSTLQKSGKEGAEALGAFQAATILDTLDAAFTGATTRKIDGVPTFSGTKFRNKIDQIGTERLKKIFSSKAEVYRDLMKLYDIAGDITPQGTALPKGSATTILDTLNRLGILTVMNKVPGAGLFAEGLRTLSEKSVTRNAVERALSTDFKLRKIAGSIDMNYPSLASALGIAGVAGNVFDIEDEENGENN